MNKKSKDTPQNTPIGRNSLVFLMLVVIVVILVYQFQGTVEQPDQMFFNQVAETMHAGDIARIVVDENKLEIVLKDGTNAVSRKEPSTSLVDQLIELGVTADDLTTSGFELEFKEPSNWNMVLSLITYIFPVLLIVGLMVFMFRQAQGSNNQAMSFGRSRARMFVGDQPTITFEDVAGVDEAKEELEEIVEFLKEPEKFISLGARIPKGVLLMGSPGTGKTLLAKAVSGEAGVPFFSISGSEFVEMFVGVGASRVRDLFEQAKKHSPCIVFVDEIDAVGRQRGAGLGGSHDEREQTLNQILVEMDGFDTDTNVIIVAATNRPDVLDPALLRPGRFDRRVILDSPDRRGREAILKIHVRGKPLEAEVNLADIAKGTPGFVGADLENLVNEAAILAARRGKRTISMDELEESIERVVAGPERKSRLITDEEKAIIAYHEAGHAIIGHVLPEADPVHKITVIARGRAEGLTIYRPEGDQRLMSRNKISAMLTVALGGRAAEEIIFNDITDGASNDLERVTNMARVMIKRLGMSTTLGPVVYGKKEELVFLGREISEQRDYSESVAEQIDAEIRSIITAAYERAKTILTQYRSQLDRIGQQLIEVETLDRNAFIELFDETVPEKNGGTPHLLNPAVK